MPGNHEEQRVHGRRGARSARHGALALVVGLVLTALPVTSSASASPTPAATGTVRAQTSGSCTSVADVPFLLPAWGDQGGWAQRQQYLTITGADVDGDGTDELIGRNASQLEVFEWAPPSAEMGPASPGQWVASTTPGPAMPETDWYFDQSVFDTFQTADVDADGAQEVLIRQTDGLRVFDLANGTWTTTAGVVPFSDTGPDGTTWYKSPYFNTITTGDVDGDGRADVLGRSRRGVQVFEQQPGGTWLELTTSPTDVLDDSADWNQPQYFKTIRVGDVTGDRRADLVARGKNGLEIFTWTVTDATTGAGSWTQQGGTQPWTDGAGWTNTDWYETIGLADLDGDGADEVYGRTSNGLDVWGYDLAAQTWSTALVDSPSAGGTTILTDAQGFTNEAYWYTIQASRVLSRGSATSEQILARFPDGVHVITLTPGAGSPDAPGTLADTGITASDFADNAGAPGNWAQKQRYETIRTVDVPGAQGRALIGRDATGMRTTAIPVGASAWADPTAPFPTWSNNLTQPLDPLNRAYTYLSTVLAGGAGPLGLRSAFTNLDRNMAGLRDEILAVPRTKAINVTREEMEQVKGPTAAWADGVHRMRIYFGVGTESGQSGNLASLIQTVFITGASPEEVKSIEGNFASNPAFEALMADLIWGIIGGMAGFFTDGLSTLAAARVNAGFSLVAAGTAGGLGFLNPDGSVDTEGDNLSEELQNTFCAAIEFLNTSHDAIGDDLGQLTAMRQMLLDGYLDFSGDSYADALALGNTQVEVWIYQQFSAMDKSGWRSGYCETNKDCNVGFFNVANNYDDGGGNPFAYKALPTYGTTTPDCIFSDNGYVDGWGQLTGTATGQLGVDPGTDIFWPRVPAGRPDEGDISSPYTAPVGGSTIGILGWRLGVHSCQL
jgi:hypothetical protein